MIITFDHDRARDEVDDRTTSGRASGTADERYTDAGARLFQSFTMPMSGKARRMLMGFNNNNEPTPALGKVYQKASMDPLTRYNASAFGFKDLCFPEWSSGCRRPDKALRLRPWQAEGARRCRPPSAVQRGAPEESSAGRAPASPLSVQRATGEQRQRQRPTGTVFYGANVHTRERAEELDRFLVTPFSLGFCVRRLNISLN